MKIRLAILDSDERYLNRIVSIFSTKYADRFEIYSFTDCGIALSALDRSKIDVFLANDQFDIDIAALPKRCGFAYFVDAVDVDKVRDQRTICKFQKAELIYKQILNIYSEKVEMVSGVNPDDDQTKVIFFNSVSGGTGASTMAAACAMYFAAHGKRTLYLNLEKFGSSDVFFHADGPFDMSDIIFSLKSKKANFSLKLESCVKRDISGVFFYSEPKIALDMLELNNDEKVGLINELKFSGAYDDLIIDTDFSLDRGDLKLYQKAHAVVWVGDGSKISNMKITRAYSALAAMEQNSDFPMTRKIRLLYNKFSNKTGQLIEGVELKHIGGAPRYEHANVQQMLGELSKMNMFDRI